LRLFWRKLSEYPDPRCTHADFRLCFFKPLLIKTVPEWVRRRDRAAGGGIGRRVDSRDGCPDPHPGQARGSDNRGRSPACSDSKMAGTLGSSCRSTAAGIEPACILIKTGTYSRNKCLKSASWTFASAPSEDPLVRPSPTYSAHSAHRASACSITRRTHRSRLPPLRCVRRVAARRDGLPSAASRWRSTRRRARHHDARIVGRLRERVAGRVLSGGRGGTIALGSVAGARSRPAASSFAAAGRLVATAWPLRESVLWRRHATAVRRTRARSGDRSATESRRTC
jgi:hypothetical protein